MTWVLLLAYVALTGAALSMRMRGDARIRRMQLGLPPVPVAAVRDGELVHVRGRIVPSDQLYVTAPFTGRKVAWCRARAETRRRFHHEPIDVGLAHDFLIEDDAGGRARVRLTGRGTEVLGAAREEVYDGAITLAPSKLQDFVSSRGVSIREDTLMRFVETRLSLGQALSVIGTARREQVAPTREGYRESPASELVLNGSDRERPLLLITESLESARDRSFVEALVMWAVVAGGAALLAYAVFTAFAVSHGHPPS